MFGTTDLNNINALPGNPELGPVDIDLSSPGALSPEDLVARAKASIAAASAVGGGFASGGMDLGALSSHGPAVDMRVGMDIEPKESLDFEKPVPEPVLPRAAAPFPSFACADDLEEAEAEVKVRVKTGDLLYTRADLIMRRENHLSAVVDGVLLDLGTINTDLMNAMALAHQVHVSAMHYMGGMIERRVPLVHQ